MYSIGSMKVSSCFIMLPMFSASTQLNFIINLNNLKSEVTVSLWHCDMHERGEFPTLRNSSSNWRFITSFDVGFLKVWAFIKRSRSQHEQMINHYLINDSLKFKQSVMWLNSLFSVAVDGQCVDKRCACGGREFSYRFVKGAGAV